MIPLSLDDVVRHQGIEDASIRAKRPSDGRMNPDVLHEPDDGDESCEQRENNDSAAAIDQAAPTIVRGIPSLRCSGSLPVSHRSSG